MLLLVRRLFRNLQAKPVQNEQPPVSPVQPVVQQMVAEEKENNGYTACRQGRGECSQYGAAGTEPRGYIG